MTAAAAAIAFREKPPEPQFGDGLAPASAVLLQARIKDLKLHLSGTPLERYIQQLYTELEAKGLNLRPDDEFCDVFPGSGAVGDAWQRWKNRASPEQFELLWPNVF